MNTLPPPQKNSSFSDSEVMNQIKKERSPAKKMSEQDIIKSEIETNGSGANWENVYKRVFALTQTPDYRVLRANNSLFLIHNEKNGRASVFMFNADDVKDMPKSIAEFAKAMKAANFKTVTFNTIRPAILRLLKSAGINYKSTPSRPEPGTNMPSIFVEMEL
jgi:hypothetical protein